MNENFKNKEKLKPKIHFLFVLASNCAVPKAKITIHWRVPILVSLLLSVEDFQKSDIGLFFFGIIKKYTYINFKIHFGKKKVNL